MSGKFEGVQAHLKKSNQYMDFIPCTAHSLNLVGNNAVENCSVASMFFEFVQHLYSFCSASTNRWETICGDLKSIDGRTVALKSLSETRWSARAHSTKVLCENYDTILSRLKYLSENMEINKDARNEAQNIIKKMTSLDIAFMTVLWNRVLERFDKTSLKLQEKSLDLSVAVKLLKSLREYVGSIRNNFDDLEKMALSLSKFVSKKYNNEKKRKVIRKLTPDEMIRIEEETNLSGQDKFRVETFIIIMDKLDICLVKRIEQYTDLDKKFGFLTYFKSMTEKEIADMAKNLGEIYPDDLDCEIFPEEMIHFSKLLDEQDEEGKYKMPSALKFLHIIHDNKLNSVFPNVEVAYRLYLCLPVANCSAERAFSNLKRVKNELRSTMKNPRLNALALMTIERSLLKEINTDEIIVEFQKKKRK
ncbi:zinc finger MYM-type protein 1-like [Aphis craccivora]|uniref:Zinc finger MYM-type protein 1-like n=1 Tax=Aphis craccivora TaxID=307492 RepID=A0A6G0VT49_APHCR|nr:zinc finger MYM-type protein 1-like [Aphis craccivora]